MKGIKARHRKALATAIRSYLTGVKGFNFEKPDLDESAWLKWAERIEVNCATARDWEAVKFVQNLPYTEPHYETESKECEVLIFAYWVLNGTSFENMDRTRNTSEIVKEINSLICCLKFDCEEV